MRNNVQTTISTHHQCITCMKEYESKSLEELRFEDYSVGRKGPTPGATTQPGGMFGASATSQATPLFGQTQQTSLFGTTTPSKFTKAKLSVLYFLIIFYLSKTYLRLF